MSLLFGGALLGHRTSALSPTRKGRILSPSPKFFVGTALHSLGRFIKQLGWDKEGYPLDWLNGKDEPPVLRVHLTRDNEMTQLQQDCKDQWKRSNNYHELTLKGGRSYPIHDLPWKPAILRAKEGE